MYLFAIKIKDKYIALKIEREIIWGQFYIDDKEHLTAYAFQFAKKLIHKKKSIFGGTKM